MLDYNSSVCLLTFCLFVLFLVTGKRKQGYDSDDSMSDNNKSPPSSPRFMYSHDMERDYATVKRTKMNVEKDFPLSKLLGKFNSLLHLNSIIMSFLILVPAPFFFFFFFFFIIFF